MNVERRSIIRMLTAATLVAIALPASADRDGRRGGDRHDGFREGFRGDRDIRHFERHDYGVWRSGHWRHRRHEGRLGWWWVVGGIWYFYPEPIYPFPDPYIPPPVVVAQPPQPSGPPPAQNWYFCASSNSYYPYVSSCPEGWKAVPATPQNAAPGTPAK
jgi:hypothetical protein